MWFFSAINIDVRLGREYVVLDRGNAPLLLHYSGEERQVS